MKGRKQQEGDRGNSLALLLGEADFHLITTWGTAASTTLKYFKF